MKVLVTGCSGYIGGQTAIQLRDQGHDVYGIDLRELPEHLVSLNLFLEFVKDNFSSNDAVTWIVNHKFDAIVHCAGSSLVGPSMAAPQMYYANNFVRTQRLLDHLLVVKWSGRFIFSSSAATYGDPVITPCKESDPTSPISPYGESKLMIDWMLTSYNRAYGFDFVSFRYFNACGADSQTRHGQEPGATHIIARVLESMRDKQPFTLNGIDYDTKDGTCVRDYIHVEDLANAHIMAMDQSVPAGIYNLGTSSGISNAEIIDTARIATGQPIEVETGPRREGDPAVLTADAEKFMSVCGWEPRNDLYDIIKHAWAWYNR